MCTSTLTGRTPSTRWCTAWDFVRMTWKVEGNVTTSNFQSSPLVRSVAMVMLTWNTYVNSIKQSLCDVRNMKSMAKVRQNKREVQKDSPQIHVWNTSSNNQEQARNHPKHFAVHRIQKKLHATARSILSAFHHKKKVARGSRPTAVFLDMLVGKKNLDIATCLLFFSFLFLPVSTFTLTMGKHRIFAVPIYPS